MKTIWTLEEWQSTRLGRRLATDRISTGNCGRKTSRNDTALREAFGGERNSRFVTTEQLRENGPKRKTI